VYFVFAENGVIKVQPLIVKVLLEHFVKYTFFLLALTALFAEYQNDSGMLSTNGHDNNFDGTKEKVE